MLRRLSSLRRNVLSLCLSGCRRRLLLLSLFLGRIAMRSIRCHLLLQQLSVQLPTYADNVALPAFACRTRLLSLARRSSGFAAVSPCWDRQTVRQTPYCFIDSAPYTMPTVPIIIAVNLYNAFLFLKLQTRRVC